MLLRQIKYFIAVVDHNSFSDAAEACFISQSAISQQIQTLERELGVLLLIRENRKFSVTPAGEYFYRRGKNILANADSLMKETIRLGSDDELHLRVACISSYSGIDLQTALASFAEIYPEVSIRVLMGTHEELYDMLLTGEADIVINDQRRAFSEIYENFLLGESNMYVEVSDRNELQLKDVVDIQDLVEMPCVLVSSKQQEQNEQDYFRNVLEFKGTFIFTETLAEARLMVISNQGVLPIDGIGKLSPTLDLVKRIRINKDKSVLQRPYYAFWRKEATNYYIEEFAELLKNSIQKNSYT